MSSSNTLPSITSSVYGSLADGQTVHLFTLTNKNGNQIKITNFGGIVTEMHLPDRDGKRADIALGFDNLKDYINKHPYFGALVGRVAGRITKGQFTLNNTDYQLVINDPPNHLHGGLHGLDKHLWTAEPSTGEDGSPRLRLGTTSPDGENGYPGNINIHVTYTWTNNDELILDYHAETDRPTPWNPTHHGYYHLGGEGTGTIHDHVLQLHADQFMPTDEFMTLSGRLEAVKPANDFNQPRRIGDALPGIHMEHGDVYLIRRPSDTSTLVPVATLSHPASGRHMDILSTESMVQLYTSSQMNEIHTGKSGNIYPRFAAICLECQGFSDAARHQDQWPQGILQPGKPYTQTTVHRFYTKGQ